MFKSLANLFIETEESSPTSSKKISKESIPSENVRTTIPDTPAASVASTSVPPVVPSSVDEKMVEFLAKAIEEANLDGFDYFEFRDALAGMSAVPMPEQQKFIAVFSTAKTMGLTKEKLVQSIHHYLTVLENKKGEFNLHVQGMINQEITARQQTKERKEQEIVALNKQIQQAQAKIAETLKEIAEINNQIYENDAQIKQTTASFEATYNFVAGKLKNDENKINMYLAN